MPSMYKGAYFKTVHKRNYAYILQEMQNMEEHLNAEYGRDSDGELIV